MTVICTEALKIKSIKAIKEHHIKKLREAIKRSKEKSKDTPKSEEPTYEQKEFFVNKMKRGFH